MARHPEGWDPSGRKATALFTLRGPSLRWGDGIGLGCVSAEIREIVNFMNFTSAKGPR
jgi:hypothetical protein